MKLGHRRVCINPQFYETRDLALIAYAEIATKSRERARSSSNPAWLVSFWDGHRRDGRQIEEEISMASKGAYLRQVLTRKYTHNCPQCAADAISKSDSKTYNLIQADPNAPKKPLTAYAQFANGKAGPLFIKFVFIA